jgi:hypothetical protein
MSTPDRSAHVAKLFRAVKTTLKAALAANGVLVARRRQEAVWSLRQPGRYERAGDYDAYVSMGSAVQTKRLTIL